MLRTRIARPHRGVEPDGAKLHRVVPCGTTLRGSCLRHDPHPLSGPLVREDPSVRGPKVRSTWRPWPPMLRTTLRRLRLWRNLHYRFFFSRFVLFLDRSQNIIQLIHPLLHQSLPYQVYRFHPYQFRPPRRPSVVSGRLWSKRTGSSNAHPHCSVRPLGAISGLKIEIINASGNNTK